MQRNSFRLLVVCLVLSGFAVHVFAGEGTTTRRAVEKLLQNLRDTWTKYPSKTQDVVRTTAMQDITRDVAKQIASAEIPPGETLQKVFDAYMNNLERGYETLALATMKTELNTYMKNCTAAFKREAAAATDFGKERTTQECFLLLVNFYEQIRDRFPKKAYAAARQELVSAITPVATSMLQAAKVPEQGPSASEQHDENNKLIRVRFNTNVPTLAELNSAFKSGLESYAKQVQTKAAKR